MLNTRAVSSIVQFAGGGDEKVNPGSEGITTWNETGRPFDVLLLSVSLLTIGKNSKNDPGQP